MNQDQLDQIVEEVHAEFYVDSTDFTDSYYGRFMKRSSQDQLDDYFLFGGAHQNSLLDSFVEVSRWGKSLQMPEGELDLESITRIAMELVPNVGRLLLHYLQLGYRRGSITDLHVAQKKEAEKGWDRLVDAVPAPEEELLAKNYRLTEQLERLAVTAMVSSVHYLIHNEKNHAFDRETILGGFCFGAMIACLQSWTFGGRIAEMVLISDAVSGLEIGEPDGQETTETGSDDV